MTMIIREPILFDEGKEIENWLKQLRDEVEAKRLADHAADSAMYALSAANAVFLPEPDAKKYKIKQIYVNKSKLTTTVLWEDGTHTTVRLNTPEGKYIPFSVYNAVCAALAKKVYGSNTHFKKILEEKIVYQDKTREK